MRKSENNKKRIANGSYPQRPTDWLPSFLLENFTRSKQKVGSLALMKIHENPSDDELWWENWRYKFEQPPLMKVFQFISK